MNNYLSYKVKSRQYMTQALEEKYDVIFENLKKQINLAEYVSFTTDIWQNKNKKKSFLRFIFLIPIFS